MHMVVSDMLFQNKFPLAHFPEVTDLAVVGMGLGILLSNLSFVENNIQEWDYTRWTHHSRGFLDQRALSYASALAAWIRGEEHPRWARHLRNDVRHPMKKALRYLFKTGDSFFTQASSESQILEQPQSDWMKLANESSPSKQIIAIRHLRPDPEIAQEQLRILEEKLRSDNEFVALNAMWAIEEMLFASEEILESLRMLIDHPTDEVRSKAACTLANLQAIDYSTIDRIANMLGSGIPFVEESAAFALSSIGDVPDYVLKPMNRGMLRALQMCEYNLLGHFVSAFNRWLDQPEEYFQTLLANDSPEYLEIAMETLEQVRKPYVQIGESIQ